MKLIELLSDPAQIEGVPREAIPTLRVELTALDTMLLSRLLVSKEPEAPEDRLLSVGEAAERLGVSTDYLYRHAATLSFTRRQGRKLLFSAKGLEKHIRSL